MLRVFVIHVTKKQKEAIDFLDMKLNQVLIVSFVDVHIGEALKVKVEVAQGQTCARCWNVFEHVHENSLCDRCYHIIKGE